MSQNQKKISRNKEDPQKFSKPLFNLLRDFEISPYVLNQKTCFILWYFTGLIKFEKLDELVINTLQIICGVYKDDKLFMAFVLFIYRLAILFFDETNQNK